MIVYIFRFKQPYDSTDGRIRYIEVPAVDKQDAERKFRITYPNAERVRIEG